MLIHLAVCSWIHPLKSLKAIWSVSLWCRRPPPTNKGLLLHLVSSYCQITLWANHCGRKKTCRTFITLLFFEHTGLVSVTQNQEHKNPMRDDQSLARQRQGRGVRLLWEVRGIPQAAQPHQCHFSASPRQQAPKLVPAVLAWPHSILPLYGVTFCTKGQVLSGTEHM